MNKKALYILNIISGIVFFVAVSDWLLSSLVFSFAFGLILGLGEYFFLTRYKPQMNKIHLSVAAVLGVLLCILAAYTFYGKWISSENLVRTIVTKVFSDYSQGLLIISILAGLFSLPFTMCLIGIIPCFAKMIHSGDLKRVWSEIKKNITAVSSLKAAGIVILNLIAAIVVGTALLAGAYAIPVQRIEKNVAASAYTLKEEGICKSIFSFATSKLDTWTDSLMLLEAANEPGSSPLNDAMSNTRGEIDDLEPPYVLMEHYINGVPLNNTTSYTRYWHGYMVFIKPILAITDYSGFRIINGIVQSILFLTACFLLYKRGRKDAVIPFALTYLMLFPIALAKTIAYSGNYYVIMLGLIALLMIKDEKLRKRSSLVFLWTGILTAYIDLLTYPIATFGIPMLMYLLLSDKDSTAAKLANTVRCGFFWCIGYGAMWVSKWFVGSMITGRNMLADALKTVALRTSSSGEDGTKYNMYAAIIKNYGTFYKTPVVILAAALAIYLLIRFNRNRKLSFEKSLRILFPFLLTGLAPVAWYAVSVNHCSIHFWFANKSCVVTFMAVLFGLVCLVKANEDQTCKPASTSCAEKD